MKFSVVTFCGLILLTGCAGETVKPSPSSDQVLADQYRARGGQGAISGAEISALADAYRQQIAKPSQDRQFSAAGTNDDK